MLAHVGAFVWHAREAVLEITNAGDVPTVVHMVVATDPVDLGIDEGYVQEAENREAGVDIRE